MRKVLSFVLILTLVLSSFSMAFAADATASAGLSDVAGSANAQAIEVANNLGIVTGNPDGTFQPEKSVNRAEFAAMITRALGIPQSALAGYTTTSFKDTTGYGWAVPYLAFCQSKGIMLGDGAGNAMPGRTINTNEAATMVLRALGYTANSATLVGVWPSNYVSLAQDLGIYDSTSTATNVDKQNAAQMIYNALSVQKVQVASDGTTTKLTTGNPAAPVTMLTSGLGCSDEGYSVITYNADAVINTIPYIGVVAKTYENSAGKIVAIDDIQGTSITGTYTDKNTNNVLDAGDYFTADDVDYTFGATFTWDDPSTTAVDTLQAKYFANGDDSNLVLAGTLTDKADYTFNVSLSNKTVKGLFSVEKWAVSAAAKVVAGDLVSIADGSLLGHDFATDKSDNIIAKSFELVGAKSLSDIKADAVVYVYEDTTRDEISKVAVGTEVVSGKVTKVNTSDKEWTVGGKAYAFGLNGTNGSKTYTANELGNEVKLFLDAYGDIYKYDVTSGSAKDYAVVLSMDTTGTNDGNMRLYLADDSKKTFSSDFDEWAWVKVNVDNTNNSKRLVGYGLDKDGEIDGVYPQTAANAGAWVNGPATFKSNSVVALGGDKVIDSDVVVFTESAAGAITGVAKIADVDKNTNAPIAGVEALIRDGKIVALIVDEEYVSGSGDAQYAVISGATPAVNPAGDKAQMLAGWIDGKKMAKDTVYTSGTSTISDTANVLVYKIKYNDDKNISKADKIGAKVTNEAITVSGYTSDNYLKTAGVTHAVANNAVYYEVVLKAGSVDEYKAFNGTVYPGMKVWLYETDDDSDGYDVVIINKAGAVTNYNDPTFVIADATITVTSGSSVTASAVAAAGTTPYTFVSASGAPADTVVTWANGVLNVDATAATATTAGVTVTVIIRDAVGNTASDTVTLVVNP